MSKYSVADRTCLVTGGAQGIGWSIARLLAEQNANVFVCDISTSHLDTARKELQGTNLESRIRFVNADVTDFDAMQAWVDSVMLETGRIDVLVNNAGMLRWGAVDEISREKAERVFDVAALGTFYCTQLVLPKMKAGGSGRIVNIGSIAACLHLSGGWAAYSSAKAAVEAFTEVLRLELKGTPVHATLVRPGLVKDTELYRSQVQSRPLPSITRWLPLVTPDRVAQVVHRAIQRPRRIITVPRYYRIIHLLYWLCPPLLQRICSRTKVYEIGK